MTESFDLAGHTRSVAMLMIANASRNVFDGRPHGQRYIAQCTRVDAATATTMIFSRDTGHHSSGWMKNPDYERCFHLSLSHAKSRLILPAMQRAELNAKTKAAWLRAFFGEHARLSWEESAKSAPGIKAGVVHYRLFCNEAWEPLMPRGEVYSSTFTELGWRSASQVLEEDNIEIVSTVDPT